MKLTRSLLALVLGFSIILPAFFFVNTITVTAQDANAAMQRGYRTGYSDGYMAGYRDSIDSLGKDLTRHREYEAADRAYSKDYGKLEDYRGGYKQGFANGYETGFDKKTFESTVPTSLGGAGVPATASTETIVPASEPVQQSVPKQEEIVSAPVTSPATTEPVASPVVSNESQVVIRPASYSTNDGSLVIPKDTELLLNLQEDLSTERTRQGERFTAKVMSPMEFDGAIIEGHIEKVQIPGRIKRAAELQLTFDRIVMPDGRWANFDGIVTDITAIKGDNVRKVTNEGTAIGQGSIKGDAIKIGGATGAGAGVGALVGGPVGAAVGAGIGAALGIGAAVSDRGKHIQLNANQQLRVRSSYETRIR
jgi:hypothetical protein